MAVSSALDSAVSAYASASSALQGAAQDIASGNLDNLANDAVTEVMAQTEAGAATALALTAQEMSQSLLDIKV